MAFPSRSVSRRSAVLSRIPLVVAVLLVVALVLTASRLMPAATPQAGAGSTDEVRVLAGEPTTLDPAAQGDIQSAAVTAQLFETLTALDPSLTVRPALAEAWTVTDGGKRVAFTLRQDLVFSDGTPLGAGDVVDSWLRLLDPARPSPLASLLDDVAGARAYRLGETSDPSSVAIRAPDDRHVEVDLDRPAADLPAIVAGASFGVLPPAARKGDPSAFGPGSFVGSGGYVLDAQTADELTLRANDRYWAGRPAIGVVHVVTSIGGRSPVDAFAAGDLDYSPISDIDASWIAYDDMLGPQLRSVPALSTTYYGFDTSRAPFDDVRVRQAIADAVDWRRIVTLGSAGSEVPADGMVPDGVPDRPDGAFVPSFDPAHARQLLVDAGHPGGRGLAPITLLTNGLPYDAAIAAQLKANVGLTVNIETMDFDAYQARLAADPPAMWAMSWIADYPGANDFLGVLLESDSTNNYGRWRSAAFDAAVDAAGRSASPAAAASSYRDAASIVARDVPVIPVSTGTGWALSRTGLLGAGQNGLGIVRFAGLAWQR
ncbi:MAG TPA: peptide ABC transporter substrate-binding protein [Candidatus Limnocylindrales bacterium]|nr:peptide ABC transporter substrate-binding protein [Candidatus Limnocylindrales bacterium]